MESFKELQKEIDIKNVLVHSGPRENANDFLKLMISLTKTMPKREIEYTNEEFRLNFQQAYWKPLFVPVLQNQLRRVDAICEGLKIGLRRS